MCIYTHIHTHIYIYIHTYIHHTHTYILDFRTPDLGQIDYHLAQPSRLDNDDNNDNNNNNNDNDNSMIWYSIIDMVLICDIIIMII